MFWGEEFGITISVGWGQLIGCAGGGGCEDVIVIGSSSLEVGILREGMRGENGIVIILLKRLWRRIVWQGCSCCAAADGHRRHCLDWKNGYWQIIVHSPPCSFHASHASLFYLSNSNVLPSPYTHIGRTSIPPP